MALARVNLTEKRLTVEWKDAKQVDPPQCSPARSPWLYRLPLPCGRARGEGKGRGAAPPARAGRRGLRDDEHHAALGVSLVRQRDGTLPRGRDFFHWVSALIALPTAAYSGRPFFDSAIRSLKARAVNMDVPISLGILLALGISVWETLQSGEHAYFDGAVMLIFFLLIGRVLDQMMMRRTRAVASNLAACARKP